MTSVEPLLNYIKKVSAVSLMLRDLAKAVQAWLTAKDLAGGGEQKGQSDQLWRQRLVSLERLADNHHIKAHPRPQGCQSTATGLSREELKVVAAADFFNQLAGEEEEGSDIDHNSDPKLSLWQRIKPF
jgi:hypothetical protein